MRRFTMIILLGLLSLESVAQKCERPAEVHIQLSMRDSATVLKYFREPETRFYLRDSTQSFVRKSELMEISAEDYANINFQTIDDLRSKARKIFKCEVEKSRIGEPIHVYTGIDSIFNKIYMIVHQGKKIYKFQVYWTDWSG